MSWWQALQAQGGLYWGFLAALGAVAGSFASAAIYRIPREGLSLLQPARSFCPACNAKLAWYDNLPLVSYLWLRGRCRACGVAISPVYLLNELILAGLFVWAGTTWPAGEGPLAMAIVLVALLALWIATVIDWQHLILPDEITLGGIPFGILASLAVPRFQIWEEGRIPWGASWFGLGADASPVLVAGVSALLGAAVSFAVLVGFRALFSYLLRKEALGFGDVKYMAAVGALVGLEGSAWSFLTGVMAGALLGIVNIVRMIALVHARRRARGRRTTLRDTITTGWLLGRRIPFGPPLVLGTCLMIFHPTATRDFFLETWPHLLQGGRP